MTDEQLVELERLARGLLMHHTTLAGAAVVLESVPALAAEVRRLRAELAAERDEVEHLLSLAERPRQDRWFAICGYCDFTEQAADREAQTALAVAHAAVCEKHPLAAARRRIAELEAERAWRPIDTAPRDGAMVLLGWAGDVPPEAGAWNEGLGWADADGWYDLANPTHWMPLPAPPTEDRR